MLLILYAYSRHVDVFFTLLVKLLPLYLIMCLGYVAVKVLKVERTSIARLLIYMVAPAVVFYGVSQTPLSLATLSLPFLFFFLCCSMGLLFWVVGTAVWGKESTKNLLAYAAADGNTVTFATELKVHPEKAAVAVSLSTVFALVYIPVIVMFFLS